MDWKIFLATLSAVFVAELADKTQLVGIGMSAKSGKPLTVWAGSVLAYMVVTFLSVLLGAALGNYLKPEIIRYAGASIFILVGIAVFLKII
ncbi:MAG: TMEM165/GDT1 family protein [Candidatus Omnitrophica bacterium]|nr:TMEM165/GDT1 family protein [Candidatus Omnitrophota bacterium]